MAIDFTSMGGSTAAPVEVAPAASGISLNLTKNTLLDLTKAAPGLTQVDLCAGWDIATAGATFDLDISVIVCHEDGKIYSGNDVIFYNHKNVPGISLEGDNRTGAGDGDDEIIHIDLPQMEPSVRKLVCCVTIDQAETRHQTFGMVSNSYVRLVNRENGQEILRYSLERDCSSATGVVFAELIRENGKLVFHTIGEGVVGDLNQIAARFQ